MIACVVGSDFYLHSGVLLKPYFLSSSISNHTADWGKPYLSLKLWVSLLVYPALFTLAAASIGGNLFGLTWNDILYPVFAVIYRLVKRICRCKGKSGRLRKLNFNKIYWGRERDSLLLFLNTFLQKLLDVKKPWFPRLISVDLDVPLQTSNLAP